MLVRVLKQLLGVGVSVIGGWLAGIVFEFLWTTLDMVTHPGQLPAIVLFVRPWIVALGSSFFILPVVPFLIVLYLVIPRSWQVWRWPVCTLLGVFAGISIVFVSFSRPDSNPPPSKFSWYLLAAVIAGATCFIASITRERFGHRNNSHLTRR
jgi:hypothetical protein